MKSKLTLLLVALSVSLNVFASSNNDSNQAAKEDGARAASANTSAETDSSGKLVYDENGQLTGMNTSAESMESDARMFQDITGVEGVETSGNPADADQSGYATVSEKTSFSFSCSHTQVGKIFSTSTLSFKYEGCVLASDSVVSKGLFSVCSKETRADLCTSTDYTVKAPLTAGAYQTVLNASVGLGCTGMNCLVSFSSKTQLGGNNQSLKEDAETTTSNSTYASGHQATVKSDSYAAEEARQSASLADCAGTGSEDGCEVNEGIQEGAPANTCDDVAQCLREAVSVQKFNRTCERAIPLTQQQTTTVYTSKKTCEVTAETPPPTVVLAPINDPTSPLYDPDAPLEEPETLPPTEPTVTTSSCTDADTKGFTRVGATKIVRDDNPACTPDLVHCGTERYTEYWVDLSKKTVSVPVATPTAVSGSCDLRADSPTRHQTCGEWFGRTLDNTSCSVQFTDDSGQSTNGDAAAVDYNRREGCGFCVAPTEGVTCYGTPSTTGSASNSQVVDSCEKMDLSGCAAVSATPQAMTSNGGLVVSQLETYACEKTSTQCVEWSKTNSDPSCTTQPLAQGTDKLADYRSNSGESLNKALISAATMESVASGQEGSATGKPGLYNGKDMRCRRPVGDVGEMFTPNCCAADLMRPEEGDTAEDACTLAEAELAAARRSRYTHFVGEYCSRRYTPPENQSSNETQTEQESEAALNDGAQCLRQTQTYCVFDSVLARQVQEQGRSQLAAYAASSPTAATATAPLNFPYVGAGDGSWTAPVSAGSTQVAAWQWPSYCASRESEYVHRVNNPSAPDCAGMVTTWFAACDIPSGCGELPADPSQGSLLWDLATANPLKQDVTAVSSLAIVSGACSTATGQCSYTASAFPSAKGGRATVTRDVAWPLFSATQVSANSSAPETNSISGMGDMMFRGVSTPGAAGSDLPSTVRVSLSRDGGATWQTYSVPTNQPTVEHTLTGDIRVMGSCVAESNTCKYRAVGTVEVTAKPWGTPLQPDCSGFTAGQLAALDLSKMDLQEWLSSVLEENGKESPGISVAQAKSDAQQAKTNYDNGVVVATAPAGSNFARAVPAEGYGPFIAKLSASGFWPGTTGDPALDTDKVQSITVTWGDCTAPEALPVSSTGVGFTGTHRYAAPNEEGAGGPVHSCLGSNLETNLKHTVTLTVQASKSGAHTTTLDVLNVWARYPGNTNNNANESVPQVGSPGVKK